MAKYDDYDWDELPSEVKAAGKVYLLHIRDLLIALTKRRSGTSSNVFYLSPLNYLCTAAALGFNKQLWDNDDEPDACDE